MTNHEQGSSPTDKLRSELQRLQEVLVLEQNNHQKEMELKDKMLSEIRQKKIQLILDSPETVGYYDSKVFFVVETSVMKPM